MKVRYDFQPDIEPVEGSSKYYRLQEDWYFTINGRKIWIPQGYIFDGASIPRIFWFIIGSPYHPCFIAAALAHDWLYLTHFETRAVADEVIYQLLIQNKVSTIKAMAMWSAVRSGAWWAWDNTTKDLEEIQRIKKQILTERSIEDAVRFGFAINPV